MLNSYCLANESLSTTSYAALEAELLSPEEEVLSTACTWVDASLWTLPPTL